MFSHLKERLTPSAAKSHATPRAAAAAAMEQVFAKAAMSFAGLHPDIHEALVTETMVGGGEKAFADFVENMKKMQTAQGTNEQKSMLLRAMYRERNDRFKRQLPRVPAR